jgi:hypothetical protein
VPNYQIIKLSIYQMEVVNMIKKPAPKKLSEAAQAAITQASAQQTGKAARIKSYDADFPVFDVPINQKILVYIPNHTVVAPDGTVDIRMDKFAAHPVIDGRSYGDVRCTQGVVVDELGLDGSCPLCDGMQECWNLYNHEYADVAKSKGIDPKSAEAQDALKQDRIDLINKMTIKQADVWYTFPIVVIDCEEKDGVLTTIPKKNAEGQISGHPMWYSIRERTYLEKWQAGFDSLEPDDGILPTNPAGLWAILNFTYTPKSGNHDKMGSAKALKVTFKTMNGYDEWATYFDQLTEAWTPAKAQEVVVLDCVRDKDEMIQVADTLLKPVRDKLAMYELSAGAAPQAQIGASSADNALAGFGGGTPIENPSVGELPGGNITGEMPNTGVATE